VEIVCCRAIVLKLADYRESDRLVTLFTLEHGRISGIARGAKRSIKRFGGALELFALLDVQMKFRHGLSELTSVDIITIHSGVRGDLQRIAHAAYMTELVASITPEGVPLPRLFRLVSSYLGYLDANPATSDDRRFFEINLLNILGYRPMLGSCSRCGGSLGEGSGNPPRIDGSSIVCPDCAPLCKEIPFETLKLLGMALKTGRFGALRFTPESLAQAGNLLDNAIASHLDAPLRSLQFLHEIGG
jgi:DNA repair protein RecO (recombination protein O)